MKRMEKEIQVSFNEAVTLSKGDFENKVQDLFFRSYKGKGKEVLTDMEYQAVAIHPFTNLVVLRVTGNLVELTDDYEDTTLYNELGLSIA